MKFYGGTVTGSLTVNGTQTINGTLTAQTLVVQTITSSISRITGSTQFGSSSANTHQFTGSLLVTGSSHTILGNLGVGGIPNERFNVTGPAGSQGFVRWSDGVATSAFLGITGSTVFIHANNNLLGLGANGSNNFAATMTLSGSSVGIGTETPRSLLDIRFNADRGIRFSSPGVSSEGTISSYQGNVTNNLRRLRLAGDSIYFNTGDGSDSTGTERVGIDSNGRVTITSPTTYPLTVSNTTNTSGQGVFVTSLGSSNNNASSYHYIASTGGADKFYVYGNGTYTTVSDVRLKKNISTVTDTYLDKVKDLRIVNYHWNDQEDSSPLEFGMIAQEVEELIPNIVHEGREHEDGIKYKGIQASILPYILIKAIQELNTKLDTANAKIAELEAK